MEPIPTSKIVEKIRQIEKRTHAYLPYHSMTLMVENYEIGYRMACRYLNRKSKVLDWGVGCGHFSVGLLENGFDVYGFSLYEPKLYGRFIKGIKETFPDRFHYNFYDKALYHTNLPYEDNSFDAVFSIGVLEHVHEMGSDQIDSMREIRRILRPNGIFICTHFPNRYSLIEFLRKGHERKFGQHDISRLCELSDMELLEYGRSSFLPRRIVTRLPVAVRENLVFRQIYSLADRALSASLNNFCTNNHFCARAV